MSKDLAKQIQNIAKNAKKVFTKIEETYATKEELGNLPSSGVDEELKADVEQLQTDVSALQADTEQLQTEVETVKTTVEETNEELTNISTKTNILEKKVTNLEQGIVPSPFETDSTVAYQKIVPTNALPYAGVEKVGGMTYKSKNLIKIPYIQTQTNVSGVTVTINADYSVTLNGTTTDSIYYLLNDVTYEAGKTYYLSGCPSSNGELSYKLYDDLIRSLTDWGNGASFSAQEAEEGRIYIYIAKGITVSNLTFKPMLNEGAIALPYEPYYEGLRSVPVTEVESVGANGVIGTFPIPEAVQALDGYGEGINETVYNYIDFENRQFVQRVQRTDDNTVVELAEPIVTDISNFITDDNFISVEGGGILTFKNEYEYAVPSEITYQIKGVAQ